MQISMFRITCRWRPPKKFFFVWTRQYSAAILYFCLKANQKNDTIFGSPKVAKPLKWSNIFKVSTDIFKKESGITFYIQGYPEPKINVSVSTLFWPDFQPSALFGNNFAPLYPSPYFLLCTCVLWITIENRKSER